MKFISGILFAMKMIIKIIFVIFIIVSSFILFINLSTILSSQSKTLSLTEIQENQEDYDDYAILVLGAGIINYETPSRILAKRLDQTYQVYSILSDLPIIVSGDHADKYYDEVYVMKKYLSDKGINSQQIYQDHAGYSTYDSLYRAKEVIGQDKLIIITQGYHLSRALMIAENLGITAVGVPAEEVNSTRLNREFREMAARVKDWIYLKFNLKYPSPEENYGFSLDENGELTNDKDSLYKEP